MCELSARIQPGDARCMQYRKSLSQSCRGCRGYSAIDMAMPLSDDMKNQFKGAKSTKSKRIRSVVTPAADLAVKYFDSINQHLDSGGSWITICNLIKQATKSVFHQKSLRKWFDIETSRRGLPVRQLLQGCPKSRAKRLGL